MTKAEAADALAISVRTLDRLLGDPSSGRDAVRIEGSVRIRRADIDAFVAGSSGGSFRDQIEEKKTG